MASFSPCRRSTRTMASSDHSMPGLCRPQQRPGQFVLVVVQMHEARAGNGGKGGRRGVVRLALELQGADEVACAARIEPAADQCQQTRRIADDVREEPIDRRLGGGSSPNALVPTQVTPGKAAIAGPAAPCRSPSRWHPAPGSPRSSRRGWRRGRCRSLRVQGRRRCGSAPPTASDRRGWAGCRDLRRRSRRHPASGWSNGRRPASGRVRARSSCRVERSAGARERPAASAAPAAASRE